MVSWVTIRHNIETKLLTLITTAPKIWLFKWSDQLSNTSQTDFLLLLLKISLWVLSWSRLQWPIAGLYCVSLLYWPIRDHLGQAMDQSQTGIFSPCSALLAIIERARQQSVKFSQYTQQALDMIDDWFLVCYVSLVGGCSQSPNSKWNHF